MYLIVVGSTKSELLPIVQHCLMGVSAWMTGSKLKLTAYF